MAIRVTVDTGLANGAVGTKTSVSGLEDSTIGEVASTLVALQEILADILEQAIRGGVTDELNTAVGKVKDARDGALCNIPKGCFLTQSAGAIN